LQPVAVVVTGPKAAGAGDRAVHPDQPAVIEVAINAGQLTLEIACPPDPGVVPFSAQSIARLTQIAAPSQR
jgi:hypothetical protein